MNHACYLDSPLKEELPDLFAQNLNFTSFEWSKKVGTDQGSFDNLIATHTSSATAALNQGPNTHTHILLQISVHIEYLSPCLHLVFFPFVTISTWQQQKMFLFLESIRTVVVSSLCPVENKALKKSCFSICKGFYSRFCCIFFFHCN